MTFTEIASLFGGLAMFLLGMKMMSDGLEQAAGNKMKLILEKLTSNRFLGVAVGAVITAIIQSSSATTVMVVGFVNSGLMTLRQAIWVIMGANIGTTITGQLIALDVGKAAPIMAIVGIVFIVFLKSKKLYHLGYIIGGLGILFMGMSEMSDSMSGLKDSQTFTHIISTFSNPLVGILAGAVFTAIIQSSSASVGILQALSKSGIISLSNSVYVLFGQNIGTCITAVLASIGTNRNARRTTVIHLMFNIIGTIVFVTICMLLPFTNWVESLTPDNPSAQIANVHTIFNITTTLILLPFGSYMEKIAKIILPETANENEDTMKLHFISLASVVSHSIGSASIAISQIQSEIQRMYEIALFNVEASFDSVITPNKDKIEQINKNEDCVDFLNAEISKYISSISSIEMTEQDAAALNSFFQIIGNIERISDHAVNIMEYSELLEKKKYKINQTEYSEIEEMKMTLMNSLELLNFNQLHISAVTFNKIKMSEEHIDALTENYRGKLLEKMHSGTCNGDINVIFSEMITDFERIGDHILNLAEFMSYDSKQVKKS